MENDFIPKLDARHFQLLLSSAKAQAFIELKQTANTREERKERRQMILAQKTKDSVDNRPELLKRGGYGRK
jgi:hypothetical protein